MRVIRGDESVSRWALERIPHVDDFGPHAALAVVRGERVVAAAVYHNYCHPNIELSFASDGPGWAARRVIRQILAFPFAELGCKRITTITPAGNERAINVNLRLGFEREALLRDLFEHDDAVICGLLKQRFMELWGGAAKCGGA